MKALFCVDSPHENYLPPRDGDSPVEGFFGQEGFGYWICQDTEAPLENTVMVVVNTSEEILDKMAADTEHWIFIEDLPDEEQ
jgi:hypothetical protein